jgi:hypothetical protein
MSCCAVTYIYVGKKKVGSVTCCGEPSLFAVSWSPSGNFWVYKQGPQAYYYGFEHEPSDDHISASAYRKTAHLWVVRSRATIRPAVGTVRYRSRLRWDIYNARSRLVAHTRGPDGVAAGLAWLAHRSSP